MSLRSRRRAYHRRLADWPALTTEAFDDLVRDSLEALPTWARPYLDRVAVVVEEEPPADEEPELLGLYVGATLLEEPESGVAGATPDMVLIFQGPHERQTRSRAELRAEVAETVLHEIAHHFGIEEETLDRIGPLRPRAQPPGGRTGDGDE
ncbi:MAG: metallopeptidase family protein [Chloroflexota bacterium]